MNKTKFIDKGIKPGKKPSKKVKKPLTDKEGDPLIENLNDFVTAIKPVYTSKPIYTGGRIMVMQKHIYASCNHGISVYSFETEQVIETIKHNNEQIVNFCVCPYEKYIVTFTKSSLIRVMTVENRKILHTLKVEGMFANVMQFSPNGKYLAFGFGGLVHIYTFQTMKKTHHYNPSRNKSRFIITKLQWHPDPNALMIITTDFQRKITVFDYILNKIIAETEEGQGGSNFAMTSKGTTLVSINNLQLKISQTKTLKLLKSVELSTYMQGLQIVNNTVYFGGEQTQLFSISLDAPQRIKKHAHCTDSGVMKIINYGNKKLMVLSSEQNISMLKYNSNGQPIFQKMIVGYNDEIIDLKYSKHVDSNYFIMVTNSNNVKVINRHTQKLQFLIEGHADTVLGCDYMHPWIITGGKDNTIKLWKIQEQKNSVKLIANYHGHSADILSLCFLKHKKLICSVSDDKTLKIWSLCQEANQKIQIKSSLHTISAHTKSINAVRVSPKEDMIATCSQDRVIKIWTTQLNVLMSLVGHKRGVWDVTFHQVEQLIVSVSGDGMIKGWNIQTGECLWSMGEGPSLIRCSWIYYNQVVTGSLDGIIKIWDVRKKTSLSYDKHEGKIWALDVLKAENGIEIISGAGDSVYHVWKDCTKQTRNTIMERNQEEQIKKINYQQQLHERNYKDAALIAFQGGYNQLFINVMNKIQSPFDAQCKIKFQDDQIMVDEAQQTQQFTQQQFSQLMHKLKEIDLQKLLLIIQTMNSTVRHYKMANKMLMELLRQTSITELAKMKNSFFLPDKGQEIEELNEKKSDFQKWLNYMISYDDKHISRTQRYLKGSYWIDHLHKQQYPLG